MVDEPEIEEDYEEQLEQMLLENGMLIQSIANLLIRKGVISQDEVEAEMNKLYDELEAEGGDETEGNS